MALIITFGCKVNQYESQLIKENIEKNEYFKSDNIVIINSCCVTAKVEKDVRKKIKNLLKNGKKIYLTGCIVEKGNIEEEFKDIHVVKREYFFNVKDKISHFNGHTRCFIKIEDGCENFCSYCIIPFVRGKVKSRKEKDIIEEINCLAENGYKEIVLTGIDLGSYGKDTGEMLSSLIEEIERINEIERIRLSSIEIYYIDEFLIRFLKNIKKFCPHFHIPLQSGSNRILNLMGRRYSFEEYYEKIKMIKENIEKVTFTTDIMVGFPQETEEDFEKTCLAVEKIGFLKVHIFPYSEREYTSAIFLPDKISEKTKKERLEKLLKIADNTRRKTMSKFIGIPLKVLFEKRTREIWKGYSENYIPIITKSKENLKNKIVSIIPKRIFKNALSGVIYNQKGDI